MHTVTTNDRLALVTVWVRGEPWVVVDICLRMLVPRELANATGFPRQYVIDRGHDGRMFTKTQQVAMISNAVPPGLQRAVTAANYSDLWDQPLRWAA
ncbi:MULTISPECIES: DNA cytosine methyltransferase [unclassified Variovorax]|uniref:DNA cytosine methyltransferase n=1 Tax=unclassified Variovorax TaxID=663243 RepID=UPI003ECD3DCB